MNKILKNYLLIGIIILFTACGDGDLGKEWIRRNENGVAVAYVKSTNKKYNGKYIIEGQNSIVEKGEMKNGLLHGTIESFDYQGYPTETQEYKNGNPEGKWIQYYPSSNIKKSESNFSGGYLNGEAILYNKEGKKEHTYKYKDGHPYGKFKNVKVSNKLVINEMELDYDAENSNGVKYKTLLINENGVGITPETMLQEYLVGKLKYTSLGNNGVDIITIADIDHMTVKTTSGNTIIDDFKFKVNNSSQLVITEGFSGYLYERNDKLEFSKQFPTLGYRLRCDVTNYSSGIQGYLDITKNGKYLLDIEAVGYSESSNKSDSLFKFNEKEINLSKQEAEEILNIYGNDLKKYATNIYTILKEITSKS